MKTKNRIAAMVSTMLFSVACTNSTSIALDSNNDVVIEKEYEQMILYTTDWLRVREEPSVYARIIDVYEPGTEVVATDVTNRYNGWVQIQYDNHNYYMHSDWLTMVKPEQFVEEAFEDTVECSKEELTGNFYVPEKYSIDGFGYDTYPSYMTYSPGYFKENGVIEYDGYYFTYYSERVLPGDGLYIPGRWTDEYGFVRDGNGCLCLASNTPETMDRFSTVYTPWGLGVIYDYGTGDDSVIDVYVGW